MNPIDILEHHIKQRRGELSFSASKPKAVKQWANKLLELPLGDACLQLWQALKEIHELDCDENLRFELLRSVELTAQKLCQQLYNVVVQYRQVQYDERHKQILQLLLGIHAFLLRSYYDIMQRIDEQWKKKSQSWYFFSYLNTKTTLIKAGFYGLRIASNLLHYQILFDIPAFRHQWYLIHQIYGLSKKNHQHLVQLNVFVRRIEKNYQIIHIEQQYKQILLYELLSTTHLSEADLSSILTYSYDWANYLKFTSFDESKVCCKIASEQDIPIYFSHQNQYQHIQADIAVSLADLIQFFEHNVMSSQHFMGSSTLRLYIHHVLTHGYKRRDERFSYVTQLDAYLGFSDILNVLSQQNRSQEYVARHNLYHYSVEVLDKSKSGYKIRWQDNIPFLLKKGNLLLIKEKDDDGRMNIWQTAMIRWVQKVAETTVEIGVEIIARHQLIVQIENQSRTVIEPALLIYSRHSIKGEQYALILAKNSQLHHRGQSFNMIIRQINIPIKLKLNNYSFDSHYVQKYDIKLQKIEESDILSQILTQSLIS